MKKECDQQKNNRNVIEGEIKDAEVKLNEHKTDLKTMQDKLALVRQCSEKVRRRETELANIQSRNISKFDPSKKTKVSLINFFGKIFEKKNRGKFEI